MCIESKYSEPCKQFENNLPSLFSYCNTSVQLALLIFKQLRIFSAEILLMKGRDNKLFSHLLLIRIDGTEKFSTLSLKLRHLSSRDVKTCKRCKHCWCKKIKSWCKILGNWDLFWGISIFNCGFQFQSRSFKFLLCLIHF